MNTSLIEANSPMAGAPLRAAVLGVGRMGRRHITAVRRAGHQVVAVFDTNLDALQLAQQEHGLESSQLFTELAALYELARPELVIVATTADSHCELTCMAAQQGARYVLCEKPMAVSIQECDRMIETCKRMNVGLAVNHQMRFMEQYTVPKTLFANEAYGGLQSMTVVAGNFGFAMNGSHYFEAFHFLTEEPIAQVTSWMSSEVLANPRGAQFEDRSGSIRATTAGGRRLYMEIGADQGHGIRVVYACRNGMVSVNELSGEMVQSAREAQYRSLPSTRYGMSSVDKIELVQPCEVIDTSAAVIRSLVEGRSDNVSGEDGRRVIEVLCAAYMSAKLGSRPVDIPFDLDRNRVFAWA